MKQQILLTAAGILLLTGLFLFGSIESQKSNFPHAERNIAATFNITDSIQKARQALTSSQILYVTELENSIKRGDVKQQSHNNFIHIANFWKDSVKSFLPYVYYLSEASKLDNSEKSLTFAARLILDSMRREENELVKAWESEIAIVLFEKAIQLNPSNQDLKIDLGSCYVYGKGMGGNAAETMKGIQQLLSVVVRDSTNMKAQMILGIGGVISKQYDKAIARLNKVVVAEPGNLEAISWLADVYAETGDKVNAIKWYEYSKKLVNNPEYSKEVNIRIKTVQ
ncbi:MAG: tetratricopeptide repeat protein [Ginsengibacter sp.]